MPEDLENLTAFTDPHMLEGLENFAEPFADDFDLPAARDDFRARVDALLPPGIHLRGDTVFAAANCNTSDVLRAARAARDSISVSEVLAAHPSATATESVSAIRVRHQAANRLLRTAYEAEKVASCKLEIAQANYNRLALAYQSAPTKAQVDAAAAGHAAAREAAHTAKTALATAQDFNNKLSTTLHAAKEAERGIDRPVVTEAEDGAPAEIECIADREYAAICAAFEANAVTPRPTAFAAALAAPLQVPAEKKGLGPSL